MCANSVLCNNNLVIYYTDIHKKECIMMEAKEEKRYVRKGIINCNWYNIIAVDRIVDHPGIEIPLSCVSIKTNPYDYSKKILCLNKRVKLVRDYTYNYLLGKKLHTITIKEGSTIVLITNAYSDMHATIGVIEKTYSRGNSKWKRH